MVFRGLPRACWEFYHRGKGAVNTTSIKDATRSLILNDQKRESGLETSGNRRPGVSARLESARTRRRRSSSSFSAACGHFRHVVPICSRYGRKLALCARGAWHAAVGKALVACAHLHRKTLVACAHLHPTPGRASALTSTLVTLEPIAGDLATCNRLLEQGADINAKDSSGWTALRWAVQVLQSNEFTG